MQRNVFPAIGAIGLLLLTACGGGGGSSGPGQVVISAATPPPGMTGVSYTYTFTVASGGVAPFTWSETGALPQGLSLTSSGQLVGIPASAATYPITVMVADSSQPARTSTLPVNLVIQDSPIVVAIVPAPPAGARGNAYPSYTFRVSSGGSPGFTWAITAGALPPGLALASNGMLTGTPTSNGTSQFTATATDSATPAGTGSAPFTIMVNNPLPPSVENIPPPTGTVGGAFAPFQFQANNGLPPLVWQENGSMPGFLLSTSGVVTGTPTTAGHFPITVTVTDALGQASPATPFTIRASLARPASVFMYTGSMHFARYLHSATLLKDGTVLVAGGVSGVMGTPDVTAEIYDPVQGVFADAIGQLTTARAGHAATLLNDDAIGKRRVLIVGGSAERSAELYDPATGMFTATKGIPSTARFATTATLLNSGKDSGKVLVAGGATSRTIQFSSAAELYDPKSDSFMSVGNLHVARSEHTATLLNNGMVLVAGGSGPSPLDSAELYDPVSETFTTTGSMSQPRSGHTATLLNDATAPDFGKVLVVGTDGSADLYDPSTGTFTAVDNVPGASSRTASLRSDGTVVVAGGMVTGTTRGMFQGRCETLYLPVSVADAELFAPESEGFTPTGSLRTPRDGHTSTQLADGSTVLVVGGVKHFLSGSHNNCTGAGASASLSSAELFK